jgi:hypothetical protein
MFVSGVKKLTDLGHHLVPGIAHAGGERVALHALARSDVGAPGDGSAGDAHRVDGGCAHGRAEADRTLPGEQLTHTALDDAPRAVANVPPPQMLLEPVPRADL